MTEIKLRDYQQAGCDTMVVIRLQVTIMTRRKFPLENSVYGVATIGSGRYISGTSKQKTMEYQTWFDMLRRCYSPSNRVYNRYGGNGVTVCETWRNFQNFAPWFIEHHIDGFKLDKDLTNIGAKEYSKENCEFIPVEVNNLFVSSNSCRGKWPVGVSFSRNRFIAECWNGNKQKIFLGGYGSPEEAFDVYKEFKMRVIRDVAIKHYNEGNISEKIYNNLLNWKVVPYPE